MSETTWKRVRDGIYELRGMDGRVLATVERHDHPMSGHFALWVVSGETLHFPTKRDAQAFAVRRNERSDPLIASGWQRLKEGAIATLVEAGIPLTDEELGMLQRAGIMPQREEDTTL